MSRFFISVLAATLALWSGAAHADDLTVVFSVAKPPFVFATHTGPARPGDMGGIELDITTAALGKRGHHFTPRYATYDELTGEVLAGRADAAATVRPENPALFYSGAFVFFHNFAITAPGTPAPATVADLARHRMVAWEGATKDLGPAFAAAAAKAPAYAEIGNQEDQAKAFFDGRFDTLVIDGNIFRYWARVMGRAPKDFAFAPLFGGETTFVVGFARKSLRDDFDAGLQAIKADGTYRAIFRRYLPE